MADSKEVVVFNTSQTNNDIIWNPEFIEELLPCSQQVSLLYHMSYLCLAKFPKCEKQLRMRAGETQLLFGSSEAAFLKCVGTSQNLVTSLFPMLVTAIEKNKPIDAVRYLEEARAWISDLIGDVEQMVERFEVLILDVATTTSDIIKIKKETEKLTNFVSKQIEKIMKIVKTFEDDLKNGTKQLTETENQIDEKNRELQDFVRSNTSTIKGLWTFAAVVPFLALTVHAIYQKATDPGVIEKTKDLEGELNRLNSEKISQKKQEWNLLVQLIDWHMKLSKLSIEHGLIPFPIHLSEVQRYLCKIQNILLKLTQFWKYVDSMVGTIKNQTFVGEEIMDDPDFKHEFLESIQTASEMWTVFGGRCNQCVQIFRVQSKDAYKFLEINPDTLSPEVWLQEYDSVMEQLKKIKVSGEDGTPAIQQ